VLVVAEDAALEFAGYGHGGLWYPVPQSTRAGMIVLTPRRINGSGEPLRLSIRNRLGGEHK
jgi:hypothetical protein